MKELWKGRKEGRTETESENDGRKGEKGRKMDEKKERKD